MDLKKDFNSVESEAFMEHLDNHGVQTQHIGMHTWVGMSIMTTVEPESLVAGFHGSFNAFNAQQEDHGLDD